MLNILLSNDDGVLSPGLLALREKLSEIATVTVIAPETDFSGSSSSITLQNPLRVKQLDTNYYALSGTPADCVHAALSGLISFQPDLVITGINNNANLGDDVIYSGTFSAAYEGRSLNFPSIALSMVSNAIEPNYETGAMVAAYLVEKLMQNAFRYCAVLNVNIPDCDYALLKGYKITRLGKRQASGPIQKGRDPRGNDFFWIGHKGRAQNTDDVSTDFYAVKNGYVSITPVSLNMIDEKMFSALQDIF